MLSKYLKSLSILKKFLFINLIIFTIIGLFTIIYLINVQPNLIKKKSINHISIIDNTVDNILRLDVKFNNNDVRKFLFSTRFIFQNLDRVVFFDNELNLIGDTDTLDLDPRSFSTRLSEVEFESLNEKKEEQSLKSKNIDADKNKLKAFEEILNYYSNSEIYGKPTGSSFGVIFKRAGETVPRHPTQLYEALSYLVLFFALWHFYWKTDKKNQTGFLFGLFMVVLWTLRFVIEFLKEAQVEGREDWVFNTLNTGQVLSIPLVLIGFWLMFRKTKATT